MQYYINKILHHIFYYIMKLLCYLYEYTHVCIFKYIKYLRFNEITSDPFINELFSSFLSFV